MKLTDLSRRPPVTVRPDARISEAAEIMDRKAVGAVMVVDDDDRLVGIVTDRDLVVRALARRAPLDGRIDSVMSTDVVTLDEGADVREACRIFGTRPIRRLPILAGEAVVGMVTVDDLTSTLVGELADMARPVTAEVLFGHPEPGLPVRA